MSTSISPMAAWSCPDSTTATTRRRERSSPPVFPVATFSRFRRSTLSKAAAAFIASRNRNPNEKSDFRHHPVRLHLGQARQHRTGERDGPRRGGRGRQCHSAPGTLRDSLFLPG